MDRKVKTYIYMVQSVNKRRVGTYSGKYTVAINNEKWETRHFEIVLLPSPDRQKKHQQRKENTSNNGKRET